MDDIDPLAAALVREARLREAISWFLNLDDNNELIALQDELSLRAKLSWDGSRWADDPAIK